MFAVLVLTVCLGFLKKKEVNNGGFLQHKARIVMCIAFTLPLAPGLAPTTSSPPPLGKMSQNTIIYMYLSRNI